MVLFRLGISGDAFFGVDCIFKGTSTTTTSSPTFRLLRKLAVNGTHKCDSHNLWEALSSKKQRTKCCRRS